jgi:hypothetical protein
MGFRCTYALIQGTDSGYHVPVRIPYFFVINGTTTVLYNVKNIEKGWECRLSSYDRGQESFGQSQSVKNYNATGICLILSEFEIPLNLPCTLLRNFTFCSNLMMDTSVADPDPDPSDPRIHMFLNRKWNYKVGYLDSYCFMTSFWLFVFEEWSKCTFRLQK